ncbi:hypothetical protein [Paraglaciecola sp. MB-3u-78]|uniref:hypothetical protein n=1 Tax=Paraglaciecola sp. MB-3u-78 TaxID=2058332 RepID=UPI001E65169A|nr:hypothetical protein [Paraglaciecola sp. MB-3u-78]
MKRLLPTSSITFPRLMSFMLNALNGSIQAELVRFFNVIDDSYLSTTSVSTAAFCKAIMKLSHQAFIALNDDLIQTFYEAATIDKWQGHRLLAVDGAVTQLPISNYLSILVKLAHMLLCLMFAFHNFMMLRIILR